MNCRHLVAVVPREFADHPAHLAELEGTVDLLAVEVAREIRG